MTSTFSTAVALRSEQSGGALSVTDNTLPARWDGPPLHHHEFDEAFYVLAGEVTFQVRDELFAAGPGAVAFAPGGVAHTLANFGDAPARYLLLCTPAGFEAYFGRLAAEAAGEDPPAWALAPTPPVTTVGGQIGERGDVAAATPIAPAGDHFNVVVHGEQNDGRVGVMLNRMPPGATGPPLHHHAFDEMFYVLEGELAFQVEDELVTNGIRRARLRPGRRRARVHQSRRCAGALPHRLHARWLRAPLRAQGRGGGGGRSACLGHAAHTVRHEGRAADRRVTDEFRRRPRSNRTHHEHRRCGDGKDRRFAVRVGGRRDRGPGRVRGTGTAAAGRSSTSAAPRATSSSSTRS